ncbi:MAG: DsbC family protein [Ramlibacter sp.]|nr:DsbC family protein [Ramlibacter sp.]
MKRRHLIATAAAAVALSACKQSPDAAPAPAQPTSAPVSIAAIEAEAKGFVVGSPMSVRTVYVFFDSQCPHCGALWLAAKPLKPQAKFIWIPVGILNKSSTAQGAALLAAKDPAAAMDEHEVSMAAQKGGISALGDLDAQKAAVDKNTALLNRFGFAAIPTIVALNAQTGALVTREGAMATPELAAFLGLQAPAGN